MKFHFFKHKYDSETPQSTLEEEIKAIGYWFAKCRDTRVSLPTFVRLRYSKVLEDVSNTHIKRTAFNLYIIDGENEWRKSL